MRRPLAGLLLLALTGCAGLSAPKFFLQTDTKTSTVWLNEFIDVDLRNVPLADLPKRSAFSGLNLIFGGVDGESVVALEASHVTRRQALWLLAEKYGLTMTIARRENSALTVLVTNRDAQRDNKPLR
ncbi:MAG: hypothetical protein WCS70_09220 [Verrucomicrobiota bacterium]